MLGIQIPLLKNLQFQFLPEIRCLHSVGCNVNKEQKSLNQFAFSVSFILVEFEPNPR